MPKMNGYQVCRALTDDDKLKDVPVVLMSAKGDQVGESFVKVMGIVDYITKPFSPDAITAVVQHTIGKYTTQPQTPPAAKAPSEAPAPGESRQRALSELRQRIAQAVASKLCQNGEVEAAAAQAASALDDATLEAVVAEIGALCPELLLGDGAVLSGDVRLVPLAEVLE